MTIYSYSGSPISVLGGASIFLRTPLFLPPILGDLDFLLLFLGTTNGTSTSKLPMENPSNNQFLRNFNGG